jgi:hypothetical protein
VRPAKISLPMKFDLALAACPVKSGTMIRVPVMEMAFF